MPYGKLDQKATIWRERTKVIADPSSYISMKQNAQIDTKKNAPKYNKTMLRSQKVAIANPPFL